jgi:hypothetical protein
VRLVTAARLKSGDHVNVEIRGAEEAFELSTAALVTSVVDEDDGRQIATLRFDHLDRATRASVLQFAIAEEKRQAERRLQEGGRPPHRRCEHRCQTPRSPSACVTAIVAVGGTGARFTVTREFRRFAGGTGDNQLTFTRTAKWQSSHGPLARDGLPESHSIDGLLIGYRPDHFLPAFDEGGEPPLERRQLAVEPISPYGRWPSRDTSPLPATKHHSPLGSSANGIRWETSCTRVGAGSVAEIRDEPDEGLRQCHAELALA